MIISIFVSQYCPVPSVIMSTTPNYRSLSTHMLAGARRAHELQGAHPDHAELLPIDVLAPPAGRLRTPSPHKHFFA